MFWLKTTQQYMYELLISALSNYFVHVFSWLINQVVYDFSTERLCQAVPNFVNSYSSNLNFGVKSRFIWAELKFHDIWSQSPSFVSPVLEMFNLVLLQWRRICLHNKCNWIMKLSRNFRELLGKSSNDFHFRCSWNFLSLEKTARI